MSSPTTPDVNRMIMDLRDKTGAGIMDCKKALTESRFNFDEALTALRKKGLADAAKKSTRVTKEGLVAFAVGSDAAAIIELNCETDFVARTSEFQALAAQLASEYAQGQLKEVEDAKALIQPVFAKLGENMALRRVERFEKRPGGFLAGYVHLGGKTGALIELSAPAAQAGALSELAKELLFQIVAAYPRYLRREDVPSAQIEKEKEIFTEQLKAEGKPEASIPKIVEGKVNKLFYQSQCLLEQMSIRDNKTPISKMLEEAGKKLGGAVTVARFARYQLGE
ncbi:MAG: translation elongation factor Ts [Elusimicrobia bacterium]|nr:translation elongation factor Ts [Elusimicrobiota bacterium]